MVGRIWDVAAGQFIDCATLVERLRPGRFVLLGEKHDNPDHHRLQAWLLRELIASGRRPAVGFEMFTVDDAPAIARQLAAHPADAAGLAGAVNWERRGWPAWAMYQPIAEVAMQATLPIIATNLAPATARALGQSCSGPGYGLRCPTRVGPCARCRYTGGNGAGDPRGTLWLCL
jgi:uncharacterized iron-regulated protein